jgi:hypothetical protein
MTPTPKVEIIAGKIRVVCYGVLVGEPPKAKADPNVASAGIR